MSDGDSAEKSHLAVLLDTNIWRADPLLRGADGAALLHYLHQMGHKLALPQIVEIELTKHLHLMANESAEKIDEGWRFLERIIKGRPDFTVPTPKEVEEALSDRLTELSSWIIRVPIRFEHTRAALERIIAETPPNGPKNQQYKDSLIWEAVLELASKHRVGLVTKDGGFYNRDTKKALANNLSKEADATRFGVEIYDDIRTLLQSLSVGAPQTNAELFASYLDPYVRPSIETAADALHFRLGERTQQDVQIYATGTPDRPALGFKLTYSLTDDPAAEPMGRRDGSVTVDGTCFYQETASEVISALAFDKMEFTWLDAEDKLQRQANQFVRLVAVAGSGRRMIPYELRKPV
jgi:PIN domain